MKKHEKLLLSVSLGDAINALPWSGNYDTTAEGLIQGKVAEVINYAIGFSALVAVVLLIVAGYTYITAAGDTEKIEKAGKTITNTLIGLAIVFIAAVLVKYVIGLITKSAS